MFKCPLRIVLQCYEWLDLHTSHRTLWHTSYLPIDLYRRRHWQLIIAWKFLGVIFVLPNSGRYNSRQSVGVLLPWWENSGRSHPKLHRSNVHTFCCASSGECPRVSRSSNTAFVEGGQDATTPCRFIIITYKAAQTSHSSGSFCYTSVSPY